MIATIATIVTDGTFYGHEYRFDGPFYIGVHGFEAYVIDDVSDHIAISDDGIVQILTADFNPLRDL